ncbi:MAG: hypothetical protein QMB60_02125 [Pseudomonadales bacterium]
MKLILSQKNQLLDNLRTGKRRHLGFSSESTLFHKRQNVDAAVAFYVELLALEKLEKNHIKVWQQGGI